MTLLAFTVGHETAELVHDSISYSFSCRHVDFGNEKAVVLPHLNAIVAAQGFSYFGDLWREAALDLAAGCASFDEFTAVTDLTIPLLWDDFRTHATDQGIEDDQLKANVFAIGYSPAAGRFVGYGYSSQLAWKRRDLTRRPYMMPMPLEFQPGLFELRTFRLVHRDDPPIGPDGPLDLITPWVDRPPLTEPPADVDAWRWLIDLAYEQRSLITPRTHLKVLMGGDVTRFTLSTDRPPIRETIHELPVDGPLFDQMMVEFRLYPANQLKPCDVKHDDCRGKLLVDCLLKDFSGTPCTCGSGTNFEECCSIYAEEAPA